MRFVDQIPHLHIVRQKTVLPIVDKTPSLYSVIFLNVPSTETAVEAISNPAVYHNSRFHYLYLDNIYQGRRFNVTFRENKTTEREDIFKVIQSKVNGLQSQRSIQALKGRNAYVDLELHNRIFFRLARKSNNFKRRVTEYFTFLKEQWNDPKFELYQKKTMVIPVDAWLQYTGATGKSKSLPFNSPLYMFYYALRRMIDDLIALGDMNIIFTSGNMIVRMNPSLCNKSSLSMFQRAMVQLSKNQMNSNTTEEEFDQEVEREELISNVTQAFKTSFNFVGDTDEEEDEVNQVLQDKIDEMSDTDGYQDLDDEELQDELTQALYNDEEAMRDVYKIVQKNKVGRSPSSIKRDQELREAQMNLKINKMTIDDLRQALTSNVVIEKNDVSDKVTTTNSNVTNVRYPQFEKAYNDHLMKKDTANILISLNEKSIPVYIRKIDIADSSDELNFKETYDVELEDVNRVRHRLKFDMPKFIDDKFMYLNGNKKIIIKQLFMKPVVKLGPNSVQIVTNYKKIFLERYGTKVSTKTERFKKAIDTKPKGMLVKYGNNISDNNAYKTTIEYDEISSLISYLKVKNVEFYFNQNEMLAELKKRNLKVPGENLMPIGIKTEGSLTSVVTVDLDTQLTDGGIEIIDYIMVLAGEEFLQKYQTATASKKFMYTRVSIMKNVIRKQVPLVLLLGYMEGLTSVLRKAGVKYSFSDTKPKLEPNQGMVEFADGFMVYENYPFHISLLMNAFADIPTKGFDIEEFDSKDAYLSIFDSMFSVRNVGNAFDNFYESMIDPITREILEDLNYPTDFVSLALFANKLLNDNSHQKESDMDIYRVRSNELVNAYLYKSISDAFQRYKLTANNNNPRKISVPQDIVIKQLLMANNVEDYSILNPVVNINAHYSSDIIVNLL
jgi:hypothetical protein